MTKMRDTNLDKAFHVITSRHSEKLANREYYKRWILKNGAAQNLRNGNRPAITLPKLAFMERPELFPEI